MNAKYILLGLGAAGAAVAIYRLLKSNPDGNDQQIIFEVPAADLHRRREEQFAKFALMQATAEEIEQLPALFFPNNPRIAALFRRYIDRRTSIGENIRMTGWISFPDNPRAAELVRRNILGLNSSKERQVLQGYWTKIGKLEEELEGLHESLYGTNHPHVSIDRPLFDADDPDYEPFEEDAHVRPIRHDSWSFSTFNHEFIDDRRWYRRYPESELYSPLFRLDLSGSMVWDDFVYPVTIFYSRPRPSWSKHPMQALAARIRDLKRRCLNRPDRIIYLRRTMRK
jgi:hypothetical protein